MYFLLGLSIALAAMLVMNSVASLLVSLLWKTVRRSATRWPAATRASVLCGLRILPVAFGVACVTLLLVPAYFTHEPRTAHEDVSAKLAILALLSAVGIGLALIRGIVTWRVTSRLTADWLSKATAVYLPGIRIPAYRMQHQFPVIAVVGTLRPRLFVANQIFESLSRNELAAAIEHEAGHILAHDNLKRSLMRACRDTLLLVPYGRLLDSAWKEASEAAADEHAVRGGASVALDLAAALVKIARIVPPGARPAMPAAALLVGSDDGQVSGRVRRLLKLANGTERPRSNAFLSKAPMPITIGLTIVVATLAFNEPHVLATVHSIIEHGVQLLN
ncbi:MAG: M48 family metalloprotease [Acidobacteriota bacterium]|nr:M48 family metalloprotease [Acidobacteriota bacterium]